MRQKIEKRESTKKICLYCENPDVMSDEHVMPETIGGSLTIPWVCKKCNEGLSDLDLSMSNASPLALHRLMEQPGTNLRNSTFLHHDNFDGYTFEFDLQHHFAGELKAQLVFLPCEDGRYLVRGTARDPDQYKEFFSVLRRIRDRKGFDSIQTLAPVPGQSEKNGPRLVLIRLGEIIFRPSENSRTEAERKSIFGLLSKKFDEIENLVTTQSVTAGGTTVEKPGVHISIQPHFGKNLRCCAKIALNYVTHLYGPTFAKRPEFEGMRRYIKTDEGSCDPGALWDVGTPDNPNMVGSRYAHWVQDFPKHFPTALLLPNCHAITVAQMMGRNMAVIEFYTQFGFLVDLGAIEFPGPLPVFHEFNYVQRSNKAVSAEEVVRIVRSRNRGDTK